MTVSYRNHDNNSIARRHDRVRGRKPVAFRSGHVSDLPDGQQRTIVCYAALWVAEGRAPTRKELASVGGSLGGATRSLLARKGFLQRATDGRGWEIAPYALRQLGCLSVEAAAE